MKLMTISIYQLCIPFTRPFRHARCHRHASDAVIIQVEDREGVRGYGEGLPRPYVTGEHVSSMIEFIRTRLASSLFALEFDSQCDPFEWVKRISVKWADDHRGQTGIPPWHAACCAAELALLDWDDGQKETFLKMQFAAQHQFYQEQFPQAEFRVILLDHEPIGRLYIDRTKDEIRLIDIALLPPHRNKGIGNSILKDILAEGGRAGLPVQIHVERFNRALRLYERLGFREIGDNSVYYLMEWSPDEQCSQKDE